MRSITALIAIAFASPASGEPTMKISSIDFLKQAGKSWSIAEKQPLTRALPAAGATEFVPMGAFVRGQEQISVDNTLAKFEEKIALGDLSPASSTKGWKLHHDGGRSSVPLNDPILAYKGRVNATGRVGLVIADGHHDFFLGLYAGSQTIAAEVKEDLSHLSAEEFWAELKRRNLVNLRATPAELAKNPPKMMGVTDNPNRVLASYLALKTAADVDQTPIQITKVKSAKNPVWVKLNNSVPFIEFYIADALTDAGIHYNPSWGPAIPDSVAEQARVALVKAQKSGKYPQLAGVPIIESGAEAVIAAKGDKPLVKLLSDFRCGPGYAALQKFNAGK